MKRRYKILGVVLGVLAIVSLTLGTFLSHNSACVPGQPLAAGATPMKGVVHQCYGSTETLNYEDIEKPVPADDEVLVKVRAASVNPLDWHYMRGTPVPHALAIRPRRAEGSALGVDFAGTVEAVGRDVTQFQPGDDVFGGGRAPSPSTSSAARTSVVPKPANLSFEQAAAVPVAAITALQGLRDAGRSSRDRRC